MITCRRLFFALSLFAACWAGPVLAEPGMGRIAGRLVMDGEGVGGVTCLINETKAVEISDSQGRFTFRHVAVGEYTLVFTLGNNVVTREDVAVSEESTTDLDVEVDWNIGVHETLTVYSASRRTEKIVDAPAAVSVIPPEEIALEAPAGQVPKLLEFTPGAEVTQSGVYDFNFNTRGFNSSVNRRVAVYLDGRDTAAPFLGAQEWSALSFPLDDLSSVEFVRGPSAALYGANSSAGVLNMTTKAPRDSQGGTYRVTGGELSTHNLDFRSAGALRGDWYYKVVGGVRDGHDFTVSRTDPAGGEYSRPCSSDELVDPSLRATPCLPVEQLPPPRKDNEILMGSVRFDKYLTEDSVITAEAGSGDIKGPIFQTGIGRIATIDSKRPWVRVGYSQPHWNVLGYFSERDAQQISLQSSADLFTDTKKYSIEFQTNWDFGGDRGRVVAGGAHTEEKIDTADPSGRQTLIAEPVDTDRQAVFAQVDWRFNEWVKLVVAGRVDASTLHDTQFSPKAAVLYNVKPNHTLRFTYNEAFQVANYSEFFLNAEVTQTTNFGFLEALCTSVGVSCGLQEIPVFAVGNEDLHLETTKSWEVGYSGILRNKAFVTVDYYNSKNEEFITDLLPQIGTALGPTLDDPLNPNVPRWMAPPEWEQIIVAGTLTLADALRNSFNYLGPQNGVQVSNAPDGSTIIVARSYTNFGQVDTQGVDLGFNYYFSDAWSLRFTYSWFDFEPRESDPELRDLLLPNTPEYKWSLGFDYRSPRWAVGVSGRWVDDFLWSAGLFEGPVEAYTTVDLDGSFTIDKRWRLGVNVANLFDHRAYQAFGGDVLGRRALAYLEVGW